jgi:hypothetical protein
MEYDTEEERRVAAAYKEAWVCHVLPCVEPELIRQSRAN